MIELSMKELTLIFFCLLVSGCTYSKSIMVHPDTKHAVTCGDKETVDADGYYIPQSGHSDCKEHYKSQGYQVIEETRSW